MEFLVISVALLFVLAWGYFFVATIVGMIHINELRHSQPGHNRFANDTFGDDVFGSGARMRSVRLFFGVSRSTIAQARVREDGLYFRSRIEGYSIAIPLERIQEIRTRRNPMLPRSVAMAIIHDKPSTPAPLVIYPFSKALTEEIAEIASRRGIAYF